MELFWFRFVVQNGLIDIIFSNFMQCYNSGFVVFLVNEGVFFFSGDLMSMFVGY